MMIKRSLLAVSIAAVSSQAAYAAPFMPMDARGLAMGNTGVASAKRAHAPAYNPSLLSQAAEDDDFALLFPQIGVNLSDEEEIADEAERISDEIIPAFEDAIEGNGTDPGLSDKIDDLNSAVESLVTQLDSATPDIASITAANAALKTNLDAVSTGISTTQSSIDDLTTSLTNISGNPLSARLGVAGALAIPSKKFAAAVSISGTANVSARAVFSGTDLNLLNSYAPAAQAYVDSASSVNEQIDTILNDTSMTDAEKVTAVEALQSDIDELDGFDYNSADGTSIILDGQLSPTASNPDLESIAEVVGVSVMDIGLSFSREFTFGEEKVAIGITPKLQKISTFHYAEEIDGFEDIEEDDITDSQEDYSKVNLDIGASWRFGSDDQWMLGLVGKNLLGGEFDYADVQVTPRDEDGNITGVPYTLEGGTVSLDPQYRAGIGYHGSWFNAALDVDLTENDPVAFENPTQYAALGVELDVFSTLQLRAGYRTNLSVSNAEIVSVGFGLSPFGIHLDVAAMANPNNVEQEAGVALETGFYF